MAGSAYVPSALATLGFTAIAPPGQALVQPLITGQQPAGSFSDIKVGCVRDISSCECVLFFVCFVRPGQPPLLAPAQSPSPSVPAPPAGGQIVTAIYPPSPSVTMAAGVVSMTAVPPSVVYSLSSPSSASPHILSKHTAAATAAAATAVVHPQQLHLDRQPDRLLPPDRQLPPDRSGERQADAAMHHDWQPQNLSGGNSVAPPGGPAGSLQPISPPLQIQTPGACFFLVCESQSRSKIALK